MPKPQEAEYDPYYQKYVALVPENEIIPVLDEQTEQLRSLFGDFAEDRGTFAYEEGKWTLKEVLSHLIDAERIFGYRVFRIARGDKTPIEGFEQDGYIENSHANGRSFSELLEEFGLLRRANLLFYKNLQDGIGCGTALQTKSAYRSALWHGSRPGMCGTISAFCARDIRSSRNDFKNEEGDVSHTVSLCFRASYRA